MVKYVKEWYIIINVLFINFIDKNTERINIKIYFKFTKDSQNKKR